MRKDNKEENILAYIVMGIYLVLLCWLVLFKLADSVAKIPSLRAINLIPFHYDQLEFSLFHFKEVIYNIIAFIPAGYYFTAFGKGKFTFGLTATFILSLGFEVLQWIFALGASDITDLMTNTVGGLLGALLFAVLDKKYKEKQLKTVSVFGAVLEAGFAALLILLIVSNR